MKTRRQKTTKVKSRKAPMAARGRVTSTADLQRQLDQRTRELAEVRADFAESLERQTATSEVLQVISSSPGELEPVLQTMLASATRICEAKFGNLFLREGDTFRAVAMHGAPTYVEWSQREPVIKPGDHPNSILARVVKTKAVLQIANLVADPGYIKRDNSRLIALVESAGARALLAVPMLKEGELVGAIAIYRQEVRPFTNKQIELVQTFADQAVIAIENTRLVNELRKSLQQKTATAEVLNVISQSAFDAQPVFETIIKKAAQLCQSVLSAIYRSDGELVHLVAHDQFSPESVAAVRAAYPVPITSNNVIAVAVRGRRVVHLADVLASGGYTELQQASGYAIGAIAVMQLEPRLFPETQVELLMTFASQAVIAIDNVRLFNELRQRTDDLTESLQQQTATADVLKVISRSTFDLPAVLQTLVKSASRLCDADKTNITREKNGAFYRAEAYGFSPEFQEYAKDVPIEAGRGSSFGRALLEGRVVHIPDVLADPEYTYLEGQRLGGYRTVLTVPMLREHVPVGVLSLTRSEVRPFTDKQVELATTFADQAAIAIENVRLFDEVQARTLELSESLQQQTATADVLQVISSSPGELGPVFQVMLENAVRICEANFGTLQLRENDAFRVAAMHNPPPAFAEARRRNPLIYPNAHNAIGRVMATKRFIHIADYTQEVAYKQGDPAAVSIVELAGARTLLLVPMLKEEELIGNINIYRQEVRPFSEKQISLLQNFARQAVIAIENARLLKELRESLAQQTATAEVLKVISRSAFDLQAVLQTLVESAARLCDADKATITRQKGNAFYRAEAYGFSQEFMDYVRTVPVEPERGPLRDERCWKAKSFTSPTS